MVNVLLIYNAQIFHYFMKIKMSNTFSGKYPTELCRYDIFNAFTKEKITNGNAIYQSDRRILQINNVTTDILYNLQLHNTEMSKFFLTNKIENNMTSKEIVNFAFGADVKDRKLSINMDASNFLRRFLSFILIRGESKLRVNDYDNGSRRNNAISIIINEDEKCMDIELTSNFDYKSNTTLDISLNGHKLTLQLSFTVTEEFPKIMANWQLMANDGKGIFSFEVPGCKSQTKEELIIEDIRISNDTMKTLKISSITLDSSTFIFHLEPDFTYNKDYNLTCTKSGSNERSARYIQFNDTYIGPGKNNMGKNDMALSKPMRVIRLLEFTWWNMKIIINQKHENTLSIY